MQIERKAKDIVGAIESVIDWRDDKWKLMM